MDGWTEVREGASKKAHREGGEEGIGKKARDNDSRRGLEGKEDKCRGNRL